MFPFPSTLSGVSYLTVAIGVSLLVFLGLVCYLWVLPLFAANPSNPNHEKGHETSSSSSNHPHEAELILVYAPWCPSCKEYLPHFDRIKTKYNGATFAGVQLSVTEKNGDEKENASFLSEHNISGFPTLVYRQNGEYTLLSPETQKLDFESTETFLKEMLPSS